jgi:hydrogenase-4 membrane subunit HyfE
MNISIDPAVNLLEVVMLFTALLITTRDSVEQIIMPYQAQSWVMAIAVCVAILHVQGTDGLSLNRAGLAVLVTLLPVILALFIRRLLIRVTVSMPGALLFAPRLPVELHEQAEREWSKHSVSVSAKDYIWFLVLVFAAFLIVGQIKPGQLSSPEGMGLTVSLALYLVGLYNMIAKRDIISQVIGLLVMDHGLYLAVVRVIPSASTYPVAMFILSLYFYILITLFILLLLLPRLREESKTIDLSDITRNSNLKG